MHVFYTPDIAVCNELPEEEAGHCLRVLRLGMGDEVMLTDGKGCFYKAVISAATNKRCQVKILETIPQEPFWKGHLHLALAPTKNMDRIEWLAEKATEIGFDEFSELPFLGAQGYQDGTGGKDCCFCGKTVAQGPETYRQRDDGFHEIYGARFSGTEIHCSLL